MTALEVLRLLVGVPIVLVLPGWAWSYALLRQDRATDGLARSVVAVGLSLAIVPFGAIVWSRVLGWPLDVLGACLLVALLTLCGAGLAWWQRRNP